MQSGTSSRRNSSKLRQVFLFGLQGFEIFWNLIYRNADHPGAGMKGYNK